MAEDERWIYKGEEVEVAELQESFGAYMLKRISLHRNRIIQVNGETEEEITGDQLLSRAIAVALDLRKRGIGEGDVVSAIIDNGLEVSYILFGTLFSGAIYAPINPDLHSDDLRHMISVLSPRVVFCAQRVVEKLREVLPPETEVVEVRQDDASWDELRRGASSAAVDAFQPAGDVDLDGPATILCSSGTTGPPKGVMLSHRALHHLLFLVQEFDKSVYQANNIILLISQNFWVSGYTLTLFNATNGFKMVIFRTFDVDVILGGVEKHRIETTIMSPPQVTAIAKHPNIEKYDVSSLKGIACGGAILSPALQKIVEDRLNITVRIVYGQTESLFAVMPASGTETASRPGTVGKAAMNSYVKIVNPETGKTVGPLIEGEICTKTISKFSGYYKNQEATANTVDEDGWVHSGDVGYADEDGYIFICDRYKELIKYRGNHVAPADIESVLVSHEAVQDAAVVGIEHEVDQEHPVGFVLLQEGCSVNVQDLLQIVKDQLPEYKHLHGGVHFVEEIPRTVTGKIKRRELRNVARTLCRTSNQQ